MESHSIDLRICIDSDKNSVEVIQQIVDIVTKLGCHVNEFSYDFMGE